MVRVTCPRCSKTLTIAEDAHSDAFVCHYCGQKLEKKVRLRKDDDRPKLALRSEEEDGIGVSATATEGDGAPEQSAQPAQYRYSPTRERRDQGSRKLRVGAWLTFLVLGGALGYARYGGVLSGTQIGMIKQYGPLIILAFHLLILLKAFRDSMFSGMLCLLVPFYSLYYLFIISDDFILRGVVAGVLVGIGQDSADTFQREFLGVCDMVHRWIMSGGGEV